MSQVSVFNFKDAAVRTVVVDGDPWWIAKDVCSILGLADGRTSLGALDEDERHSMPVEDSVGRQQEMLAINESGLYSLILRSRKPEAKAFKKWVTSEVLPAIRRTGAYVAPAAAPVADIPPMLGQVLSAIGTNLTALTGKALELEAVAGAAAAKAAEAGEVATRASERVDAQAKELARLQEAMSERDVYKRQLYRQEVERIKRQVFKAMAERGQKVQKTAHDFWEGVKGRTGVASVRVESLNVSMARRLFLEACKQARLWNVPIIVNLPLELEEAS